MALKIQDTMPIPAIKRGNISFYDQTTHEQINVNLSMNFTGNETSNQSTDMIKARAKQLLQDAIALLWV
jgi:hypothetical protein